MGVVWGSLGSHFGDFLEVSWISKNVCFTIVKLYFLRFGRVLVRDFFVLCFCIDTFKVFLVEFCGFVGPQGPHGLPNASLLGTLRDQISAELGALVAPWFQGESQTPKRGHLGSLWRHFGVSFRVILRCFLHDCFKQNVMSLFKHVVTSGRIF